MAWNYPLWYRQYRDEALEVLGRFGSGPAERQARARTERERLWVAAVETLFGEGDKQTRDDRYERAMAGIRDRYPDDPEAAAFHALAILGTAHQGRDHRKYMRAGAIASAVFDAHPDHPGAAHYVIHSFDDPEHAVLGLDAARAYARIAPDAAHAQHMTTHIFLALGMWEDVVRSNEQADAVSDARAATDGRTPSSCGHYNEWLLYGYLMQERAEDAFELLRACGAQTSREGSRVGSFVEMRSRYLLDTEDWDGGALDLAVDLGDDPGVRLSDAYIRAFAGARTGDADAARRWSLVFRELRPAAEAALAGRGMTEEAYVQRPAILELHLDGLLADLRGDRSGALARFDQAARIEAELPHAYGPPVIEKPSHELLGEALLADGSHERAVVAFETALDRAPGRTPAVHLLERAADGVGESRAASSAGEAGTGLAP